MSNKASNWPVYDPHSGQEIPYAEFVSRAKESSLILPPAAKPFFDVERFHACTRAHTREEVRAIADGTASPRRRGGRSHKSIAVPIEGGLLAQEAKQFVDRKKKGKALGNYLPEGYFKKFGFFYFSPTGKDDPQAIQICRRFTVPMRINLVGETNVGLIRFSIDGDHHMKQYAFVPDQILDEHPDKISHRMRAHGLLIASGRAAEFKLLLRHLIGAVQPSDLAPTEWQIRNIPILGELRTLVEEAQARVDARLEIIQAQMTNNDELTQKVVYFEERQRLARERSRQAARGKKSRRLMSEMEKLQEVIANVGK